MAVNPGSTSTKIAVYEDETPRLVLQHPAFGGGNFPNFRIIIGSNSRKKLVLNFS